MRINCPVCGERDSREFSYTGAAQNIARPAPDAGPDVWNDYVHNRENLAGKVRDLWHHGQGCGAWVVVTRDTNTHEIYSVELASNSAEAKR